MKDINIAQSTGSGSASGGRGLPGVDVRLGDGLHSGGGEKGNAHSFRDARHPELDLLDEIVVVKNGRVVVLLVQPGTRREMNEESDTQVCG